MDARDDDELVLLRDIATAIHRVQPIAPSVFEGLSGPGGSVWNRVPRVGNAIAALARSIVIALDDLHVITSASCLIVLAALVDYVPPGSQIVVTSRDWPALPPTRTVRGRRADTSDRRVAGRLVSRSTVAPMRGIAGYLLGEIERARVDLLEALDLARAAGAVDTQVIALAELALLDARRGTWSEAARHADAAAAIVEQAHLEDYGLTALAHVAVARVEIYRHRHGDARAAMMQAHRLRPLMDHSLPWLTVQVGIELTRAHLALGELDAARSILAETATVLDRRPDLGTLVDDFGDMRARVAAGTDAGPWAVTLTAAELRLLPYLATYITFPEIASQLFITAHTVMSEAKATYPKLDATSRAEAIDRAVDFGLLEPMFPHRASVAS